MATLVARHHVRDYATWRQVYEGAEDFRKEGGVIAKSVYRAKGDPNTILVTHTFATMAEAEAWAANPGLAEAMRQGGVDEGSLRIDLYDEA